MSRRRAAEARGRLAEFLATTLLRLHGYRILARRYRTPVGEIDVVARRGGRLAFVEVKARRAGRSAREAVTPHQRRRIARAAESFLGRRPQPGVDAIGFDLIAVGRFGLPVLVRDAWRLDEAG